MRGSLIIKFPACGAAVGVGVHLVIEAITRSKEMKAMVVENNKGESEGKNDETSE